MVTTIPENRLYVTCLPATYATGPGAQVRLSLRTIGDIGAPLVLSPNGRLGDMELSHGGLSAICHRLPPGTLRYLSDMSWPKSSHDVTAIAILNFLLDRFASSFEESAIVVSHRGGGRVISNIISAGDLTPIDPSVGWDLVSEWATQQGFKETLAIYGDRGFLFRFSNSALGRPGHGVMLRPSLFVYSRDATTVRITVGASEESSQSIGFIGSTLGSASGCRYPSVGDPQDPWLSAIAEAHGSMAEFMNIFEMFHSDWKGRGPLGSWADLPATAIPRQVVCRAVSDWNRIYHHGV